MSGTGWGGLCAILFILSDITEGTACVLGVWVREKGFYRSFFSMTGVIALQNLILFSVNLADNVMLGRYSDEAMSGVALVNQIQFLLQMMVTGVGEAVVVLATQYWGKHQVKTIRKITGIGLWLGVGVATLLFAVVGIWPEFCLGLLTDDQPVIDEGVRYLRIICFSYPLFAVTNVLLCSLRSVETVKIGFAVSLSTLLINVFLNYLLIYGKGGAPRLGAQGAAIATLAARAVECLIMILFTAFADRKIRFRLTDLRGASGALWKDYLRSGLPVFLSNTLWGFAMMVQTAILGHMGMATIGANSIAVTVFQVLTVITYGSASAASVLIGKTIGEGNVARVRQYAKTLQVLFLLIGVVTGLALFFCRDLVLLLYGDVSEEIRQLARQFMTVLSVTVCGTAYQMAVLTGVVRGGGDTRFVMINDLIFMWGLVLPLSLLAAYQWGWPPVAVFICLKCDQVLKCLVAVVKVNRYRWIRVLTRPEPNDQAAAAVQEG